MDAAQPFQLVESHRILIAARASSAADLAEARVDLEHQVDETGLVHVCMLAPTRTYAPISVVRYWFRAPRPRDSCQRILVNSHTGIPTPTTTDPAPPTWAVRSSSSTMPAVAYASSRHGRMAAPSRSARVVVAVHHDVPDSKARRAYVGIGGQSATTIA